MDRVTLNEIAEKLGLSKMSVSRALKGARGVSESTRTQVRAMAEKLGYAPDPMISTAMARMRSRHKTDTDTVAWLTGFGAASAWKSNFIVSEIHEGAVVQAARMGYRVEEFCFNEKDMTPRRIGGILYNRAIRGVIVAPLRQHGVIDGFPWQHFASVACGASLTAPHLHRVGADQFEVIQTALHSLTRLGYRRIGLCTSATDNNRVNNMWLSATLGWQRTLPADATVPPMVTDDWNPRTFMEWFRAGKPDAVLSFPEVHGWLCAAGVRTPRDCGFAVLNYHEGDNLAGVDHRVRHLGAAAMSFVAGEISANQYGIPDVRRSITSECVWRDAPSVRQARVRKTPA